jgi:hypothetical protein
MALQPLAATGLVAGPAMSAPLAMPATSPRRTRRRVVSWANAFVAVSNRRASMNTRSLQGRSRRPATAAPAPSVVCDPLWSMATSLCRQVDAPHRSDVRLFYWEVPRLEEVRPRLGGRRDCLDAGLDAQRCGQSAEVADGLGHSGTRRRFPGYAVGSRDRALREQDDGEDSGEGQHESRTNRCRAGGGRARNGA